MLVKLRPLNFFPPLTDEFRWLLLLFFYHIRIRVYKFKVLKHGWGPSLNMELPIFSFLHCVEHPLGEFGILLEWVCLALPSLACTFILGRLVWLVNRPTDFDVVDIYISVVLGLKEVSFVSERASVIRSMRSGSYCLPQSSQPFFVYRGAYWEVRRNFSNLPKLLVLCSWHSI